MTNTKRPVTDHPEYICTRGKMLNNRIRCVECKKEIAKGEKYYYVRARETHVDCA